MMALELYLSGSNVKLDCYFGVQYEKLRFYKLGFLFKAKMFG